MLGKFLSYQVTILALGRLFDKYSSKMNWVKLTDGSFARPAELPPVGAGSTNITFGSNGCGNVGNPVIPREPLRETLDDLSFCLVLFICLSSLFLGARFGRCNRLVCL